MISSLNTIFKNYSISTLNKQELKNLDKEVTFVLSNLNLQIRDYREERKKILESQDKAESKQMIDLSEKELNKKMIILILKRVDNVRLERQYKQ